MEEQKIYHHNYETDLLLQFKFPFDRPNYPWKLVFTTRSQKRFSLNTYVFSFDGENYSNCHIQEDTSDSIVLEFDGPRIGQGLLCYKFCRAIPNQLFKDGFEDKIDSFNTNIEFWDGPSDNLETLPGIGVVVAPILKGDSAYDLAVKNGYIGTEQEWLATLPGKDGYTPYIGENGNWWIDGEDTGKPSQGGVAEVTRQYVDQGDHAVRDYVDQNIGNINSLLSII